MTSTENPPLPSAPLPRRAPRWMVAIGATSAVLTAAAGIAVMYLMSHPAARFANDEGAVRQRLERVPVAVVSAGWVHPSAPPPRPRLIIAQGAVELDNVAPWAELAPAARRARLSAMPPREAAAQPLRYAPAIALDASWRAVPSRGEATEEPFAALAVHARAVRAGAPPDGDAREAFNVFADGRAPFRVLHAAVRAVAEGGGFARVALVVRGAERAEVCVLPLAAAQFAAPDAPAATSAAVRVRTTAAGYAVETPAGVLAPGCHAVAPAGTAVTIPTRERGPGEPRELDAGALAACLGVLRGSEGAAARSEVVLAFDGEVRYAGVAETIAAVGPVGDGPLARAVIVPE